jgi:hypothetical protein
VSFPSSETRGVRGVLSVRAPPVEVDASGKCTLTPVFGGAERGGEGSESDLRVCFAADASASCRSLPCNECVLSWRKSLRIANSVPEGG